jgi:hypothetical protein
MLLSYMDQRDLQLLPADHYPAISTATPRQWLPFMTDDGITVWRDTVANQLAPDGASLTNKILGSRVGWSAEEMESAINDSHKMADLVWHHVPVDQLEAVEHTMYSATRDAVVDFLKG